MSIKKVSVLGVAVVTAFALSACSPDVPNTPPAEPSGTSTSDSPTEDPSDPSETPVDPDINEKDPENPVNPDDANTKFEYFGDPITDVFDPAVVENLEKDTARAVHMIYNGELYDITHAREGDNIRLYLEPLTSVTSDSLFTLLIERLQSENPEDHAQVWNFIPNATSDGYFVIDGEKKLAQPDVPSVQYVPLSNVSVGLSNDRQSVDYKRDIRVFLYTEGNEIYYYDITLQLWFVPNAEDKWVIDGYKTDTLQTIQKWEEPVE